ncbi:TAFII55 protein conserved region-domain-containing protein [Limtongia smithiae]|uniref:TAFII55 protein conserved region-domain-containing protein n=1 Tax=Limtongia smithiae TaxID=1125753 RepID=UPI0034CE6492
MIRLKLNPSSASASKDPQTPAGTPATAKPKKKKSAKAAANDASDSSIPPASIATPAAATPLPKIKVKQPKKPKVHLTASFPPLSASPTVSTPRISIKPPLQIPPTRVPRIRVKPVRQPGQGYDSEAPDREDDPLIEEGIILRFEMESFSPAEQLIRTPYLEILAAAVQNQHGSELSMVWIKFKDSRHAIVGIRDKVFYAVLVDLPAIIEAQKTLDKKNIYKVADICQMLLILEEIITEDQVVTYHSYILPDSELQAPDRKGNRKEELPYPHGITPPMRFARQRRFRKRVFKIVEEPPKPKEKPLPKVIIKTKFKTEDEPAEGKLGAFESSGTPFGAAGSTGVADSVPQTPGTESVREGSVAFSDTETGYNMLGGYNQDEGTDIGDEIESLFGNESDDDEEDDDDDEEEDDDDDDDGKKRASKMDDEEIEAIHHLELLKEEIAELETTIESKEKDAEHASNPILRSRFLDVVKKLRKELALKKAELEDGDDAPAG